MLILNQVVGVSFLERERHRGVTCLVLSLELLMALGKLRSSNPLLIPHDPEQAQHPPEMKQKPVSSLL